MKYEYLNKTKFASAVRAVKEAKGDLNDEELIKAEYLLHGGLLGGDLQKSRSPELPLDRLTKEEVAEVRSLLSGKVKNAKKDK
ncbi:MAG: hypothetical protein AAB330_00345 [Bacteroidota bacterium]